MPIVNRTRNNEFKLCNIRYKWVKESSLTVPLGRHRKYETAKPLSLKSFKDPAKQTYWGIFCSSYLGKESLLTARTLQRVSYWPLSAPGSWQWFLRSLPIHEILPSHFLRTLACCLGICFGNSSLVGTSQLDTGFHPLFRPFPQRCSRFSRQHLKGQGPHLSFSYKVHQLFTK